MAITKLAVYQMALRHLGDARLALITDDVESRYALDDAWDRATNFVLGQAPWRFALNTALVAVGAPVIVGYAHGAPLPALCLRPHAIFIVSGVDGREYPFDLREQGGLLNFNTASNPVVRFVSTVGLDPATSTWPEHFAQTLAAYLAFLVAYRVTGDGSAAGKMSQLFSSLLPEAVRIDAVEEDFWLPYQRSGAFYRAARHVIGSGNWQFGLKTLQFDPTLQSASPADTGWPYLFTLPLDHVRTQALYVSYGGIECPFDIRQTQVGWSTATNAFTVRYLSTDALDATLWPEPVTKAVAEFLEWEGETEEAQKSQQTEGAEFQALLAVALKLHAIPEDPWLRFQLDGRYMQAVMLLLERGRWRFAIDTVSLTDSTDPNSVSDGTVSPGYGYRFLKPNDWLRTIRVYYSRSDGLYPDWCDLDYRDELDALHANYTPIMLRYLKRIGIDSTRWPGNFRDAVLAWCEHIEARADPKMAAVATAKFELFQLASKEAQNLDDESDVPKMSQGGQFVRARYGRGNFSRENAIPFP